MANLLQAADEKSASYCCEAAGTLPAEQLPAEQPFAIPQAADEKSASYCCEAAGTLPAEQLPAERPF